MSRRCEISGCGSTATVHCKWGLRPQQQGELCDIHAQQVWEQIKPLVNSGRNDWTNIPIVPDGDDDEEQ